MGLIITKTMEATHTQIHINKAKESKEKKYVRLI